MLTYQNAISSRKPFSRTIWGRVHTILFVCVLLCGTLAASALAKSNSANPFPHYPVIEDNIRFWHDIYSRYTRRQGVLHDRDNLAVVYTIVDLVDWHSPGAGKINRTLIKLARQRYQSMLEELASGKKPRSKTEQHLAAVCKKNNLSFHAARDQIRLQLGQQDSFRQGYIRSGAYIEKIKKIFRSYNLPLELAYLPHVESSFNPEAHSKAGAAGLWQFTKGTGREYMKINQELDERYDVLLATHAAARLLKKNYAQLGSWPLALTAYNYGRAGMVRAQRAHGDYENIYKNHESKLFGFASRNFYPEFLAALQVVSSLEKDKTLIKNQPVAVVDVRLQGYASFQDISHYFRISKKDLALLNPALRSPVLKGRQYIPKDYLLHLPPSKRLRQLIADFPSRLYYRQQRRDKMHTVKKGETAGHIAKKYKIPLQQLIAANNLNKKANVRIGQKLKIPIRGVKVDATPGKIITLEGGYKKKPR